MMKKKAIAVLLSLLMLTSVTLPGTWANPDDGEETKVEESTTDIEAPEDAPESETETPPAPDSNEKEEETGTESETKPETTETDEPEADTEEDPDELECTCGSEDETHAEDCPLYEAPVSDLDVDEFYGKLQSCYTIAELDSLLETLTELDWELLGQEENAYVLNKIDQLYIDLAPEQELEPIYDMDNLYSNVFDGVGPMVSSGEDNWIPIDLYYGTNTLADGDTEKDALVLDKKATVDNDGNITIELEAYATGQSVTIVEKDGADIILLLDLSSYMYGDTESEVSGEKKLSEIYDDTTKNGAVYYYKLQNSYYQVTVTRTKGEDKRYSVSYTDGDGESKNVISNKTDGTLVSNDITLYTIDRYSDINDTSKLVALKAAVNEFIDKVHTAAPKSRIAIVTYADEADVKSGTKSVAEGALVTVDDNGAAALKEIVGNLSIQVGNSNSHYAMADAVKIFQSVSSTSDEYKRSRATILFSAGIPGDGWKTNDNKTSGKDIAQATMHLSTILKTAKGTITNLSMNSNFDGGRIWTEDEIKGLLDSSDTFRTGCGSTMYCVGLDLPSSGDPKIVDMTQEPYKTGALSNEYFWRTSSHRLNGSHISGAGDFNVGTEEKGTKLWKNLDSTHKGYYKNQGSNSYHYYYFYPDELTRDQTNGYYLTTDSSGSGLERLSAIFSDLASSTTTGTTTSTTLGTSTVVKDIISPQFQLPEDADVSNITLETYKYNGINNWINNNTAMDAEATVGEDGLVSVTGFNFGENWCGTAINEETGETDYHGNKLVIRFTVQPKSGFLGGNDVYTNTNAGVYENATATEPVLTFPRPTVNVPISEVSVTAEDKNVYLLGSLTAEEIKNGATVTCGGVTIDLSKADDQDKPYGLEKWQTEYVNIGELQIVDLNGNAIDNSDYQNLSADKTYTLKLTISPKNDGSSTSQGTKATETSETSNANINVYKPELTYKDSEVYNGNPVPTDFDNKNYVSTSTVWKHKNADNVETVAGSEGVTMTGTAPTLTFVYTPDSTQISNGKIDANSDKIGVEVKVSVNGTEVANDNVYGFKYECNVDGVTGCTNPNPTYQFWLHILSTNLTITKTVDKIEEGQSFLFTVQIDNGTPFKVVIDYDSFKNNTATITIKDLKVGQSCTVTEDTSWSWRYEIQGNSKVTKTLKPQESENTFTFNNKLKNNKWLGEETFVENYWKDLSTIVKESELPWKKKAN